MTKRPRRNHSPTFKAKTPDQTYFTTRRTASRWRHKQRRKPLRNRHNAVQKKPSRFLAFQQSRCGSATPKLGLVSAPPIVWRQYSLSQQVGRDLWKGN